jgi:hypothetical protein
MRRAYSEVEWRHARHKRLESQTPYSSLRPGNYLVDINDHD